MAQLTHEQLWHVCQRKAGDYEPYGKHNRLTRKPTCVPEWTRRKPPHFDKCASIFKRLKLRGRASGAVAQYQSRSCSRQSVVLPIRLIIARLSLADMPQLLVC